METEGFLKSRMRENRTYGSVRGSDIPSRLINEKGASSCLLDGINVEERRLILVDPADRALGEGEKLSVHQQGVLHRAFSLFLLNEAGELLLQRRAMGKYHSGGLWTNSCCSHPFPGAELADCVAVRTREELGAEVEQLQELGRFLYYKDFGDGLKEYEVDHVFVGLCRGAINPDPQEAMEVAWVSPLWAQEDLRLHPERYTAWYPTAFAIALPGWTEQNRKKYNANYAAVPLEVK